MARKFRCLMGMDMLMYTWICGFKLYALLNLKANKYLVGILNSWIALPTKHMLLNVQRIKMISHYFTILSKHESTELTHCVGVVGLVESQVI